MSIASLLRNRRYRSAAVRRGGLIRSHVASLFCEVLARLGMRQASSTSRPHVATTRTFGQGRVTLVGAGPGDAELLTLKAIRALQAADVILFDDLVSDEVLEFARREAKRMLVGKRGGRDSCRQDDINDMMVRLAKAGRNVVRLKGGDPMIFGRAGEEIARLRAEGIEVSVVPGITAALAMAASLGTSLTHRDYAQSVRFVTGHGRNGDLPANIDWRSLADPTSTTVFYMGGRMASRIADTLLSNGLSRQMPAAIAKALSRPGETFWRGELSDMPAAMSALGYDEPVLIGIGQALASNCTAVGERLAERPQASIDSGKGLVGVAV